ncbi:hypothetical protein BKA65DRAFT_591698 [Rhexocercosporidium sp. MPI-PUGE-AT-0058]|nr:hypothetical protein BKA65DRAFT_591698 [Rhexocercosporidium sp. MPI-PUGE-AT-0058]
MSTSHKQLSGKSVNLIDQLRSSGVYVYTPTPAEIIADTPITSVEYDGYDAPGSESLPISLDDDEVEIKTEEDEDHVEVFYAVSGGVARQVYFPIAPVATPSLDYSVSAGVPRKKPATYSTVSDGVAGKKPLPDFTVSNGFPRKTTMASAPVTALPTQDYVSDGVAQKTAKAATTVNTTPKKRISSPPRYHPSVGGKFLLSGRKPPRKNQPFIGDLHPALVKEAAQKLKSSSTSSRNKKRSFEELESEDESIPSPSTSPSPTNNKKARVDEDEDFVYHHTSTASKQPLTKKPVKKRSNTKKADRPSKSGKQPLNQPKRKTKKVTKPKKVKPVAEDEVLNRPVYRELPRCPDLSEGTPQKKGSKWTKFEHEVLYFLLVEQRNEEILGDLSLKPLKDVPLFIKMSQQLTDFGIYRTEYSARGYWNRYGRVNAGWDERTDSAPGRSLITSAQESKAQESKMYSLA